MEKTSKIFVSFLFCLALSLVSGCGNSDVAVENGNAQSEQPKKNVAVEIEPAPTLTPAEQAEVDKYITAHGRGALVHYLQENVNKENDEKLILKYCKYLVSQGADVNAKDRDDKTPFLLVMQEWEAAWKRAWEVEQASGGNQELALFNTMESVSGRYVEIVQFLVSQGVDVNAEYKGITPLDLAVMHGNVEIVKFLVFKGADVNTTSAGHLILFNPAAVEAGDKGITPLHWILRRMLVAWMTAQEKSDWDNLAEMQKDVQKNTSGEDIEIAKFLVSKGADTNIKITVTMNHVMSEGMPLLHMAMLVGNIDLVKLLISKGADVNAKGTGSYTPLHIAAGIGNIALVKFLVSKGADVHAKTIDGKTPLDAAKQQEHTDIEKYLSGIK